MGGGSPDRMWKGELETVKERPFRVSHILRQGSSFRSQTLRSLPISDISQDRVARHLKMDSNLILATCDRAAMDQGDAIFRTEGRKQCP